MKVVKSENGKLCVVCGKSASVEVHYGTNLKINWSGHSCNDDKGTFCPCCFNDNQIVFSVLGII